MTTGRLTHPTGVIGRLRKEADKRPPLGESHHESDDDTHHRGDQKCRLEVLGQKILEECRDEEAHHPQRRDHSVRPLPGGADDGDHEEDEHPVLHDVDPTGIEGDPVRRRLGTVWEPKLHDGREVVGHDESEEHHPGTERRDSNNAGLPHLTSPYKEHRGLIAAKDTYLYHKYYKEVKHLAAILCQPEINTQKKARLPSIWLNQNRG